MAEVTGGRFAVVIQTGGDGPTEAEGRALLERTLCRDIRPLIEIREDGVL